MRCSESREHVRGGFSLVELLVVIGVVAILAALLLTTVLRAKASGEKTQCLNNQSQLIKTWALYHNDNNGDLVANWYHQRRGRFAEGTTNRNHLPWVTGGGRPNARWATNPEYLLDAKYAAFAPYLQRAAVYRCPATQDVVPGAVAQRSYGMNGFMGDYSPYSPFNPRVQRRYLKFQHVDDVTRPSDLFVFADLKQSFIGFPQMTVSMSYDCWFVPPSTVHNGGGTLAFADGHVEYKRWLEETTKAEDRYLSQLSCSIIALTDPNCRDLAWVRERATFSID